MANERKDYHHNYYLKNRERLIAANRTNRENHLGYQCDRRQKIKIEVLTHYGNGKCACVECGEERLPCLSIHHINNNGAEDRRIRAGMNKGYNIKLWQSLKDSGFPLGYQTLCMNCHFAKHYSKAGRY